MLYSLEALPRRRVEEGEMLVVCAVTAANLVKDIRENLRNLIGGTMPHYEKLIEATLERAAEKLSEKARTRGYDGVLGVRFSHPKVVEGGVEVVIYGTGFRYLDSEPTTPRPGSHARDDI